MPDKKKKFRGDDPRHAEHALRGDCRRVHIGDEIWQWKTNGTNVTIYDPSGVSYSTTFQTIAGLTDEEFDQRFNDPDNYESIGPEVVPSDVKSYIETTLR